MTNDKFHEEEAVVLRSTSPRPRADLHRYLKQLGFASEDDFYVLDRGDEVRSWQSPDLVSVQPMLAGREIYQTEDDINESGGGAWDELKLAYLLATVPESCIEQFVRTVKTIASDLGLEIIFQNARVGPEELSEGLVSAAEELVTSHGARAGSEELALLVEASYPR